MRRASKGPGGRPWQDTTIRGQKERGTGILNNEFYVGRIAWNRCSYVKDPRTGRRLARINPAASRECVDVPELRVVDDALWQRVKERQAAIGFKVARDEGGNALNRAHCRKFLLSISAAQALSCKTPRPFRALGVSVSLRMKYRWLRGEDLNL